MQISEGIIGMDTNFNQIKKLKSINKEETTATLHPVSLTGVAPIALRTFYVTFVACWLRWLC